MGFAREVREELAHVEVVKRCCRRAETAAVLRFGGALHLGPGGVSWVLDTGAAPVARRVRASLDALYGLRPELQMHEPGNLRRERTYRLTVEPAATGVLHDLGLLDARGRPLDGIPRGLVRNACCAAAYARGALMAAGSVSAPRAETHLEVRAPSELVARDAAAIVGRLTGHVPSVAAHHEGWRLAAKAGGEIGSLLARTGAHGAFLSWDAERLRRELRSGAQRQANAEAANVQRSVTAAAPQIAAAERLLASADWDELSDDLQQVALARLANPEASLAELGGLLDPPVGKSAVYRRMARVVRLAGELPA